MNVTEIISQVLGRDDNIDATDADNSTRRKRLLEYLREVASETYWRRDWPFRRATTTLTVPAGQGYVEVPPDFAGLGIYGGIYLVGTGRGKELEVKEESAIVSLRQSGYSTGTPDVCAIFGLDSISKLELIQIPTNPAALSLFVSYLMNAPYLDEVEGLTGLTDIAVTVASQNTATLTSVSTDFTATFADSGRVRISGFSNSANNGDFDVLGTVAANSMKIRGLTSDTLVNEAAGPTVAIEGFLYEIRKIPQKYHQNVLVPGLRAKARESKGDARWQSAIAEYQRGQVFMQQEESRFQGQTRQTPSYFGRTAR